MTINLGYYKRGIRRLAKLDQLEELCVRIGRKEEGFTNTCPGDLKNELQQFKKLKKVDIGFAFMLSIQSYTKAGFSTISPFTNLGVSIQELSSKDLLPTIRMKMLMFVFTHIIRGNDEDNMYNSHRFM